MNLFSANWDAFANAKDVMSKNATALIDSRNRYNDLVMNFATQECKESSLQYLFPDEFPNDSGNASADGIEWNIIQNILKPIWSLKQLL